MSHQPGNISAGTQVVMLVEARGPNGSLVILERLHSPLVEKAIMQSPLL